MFAYFFLATHRTNSCSPVLHRVVVVNVSLTVACCTKVTTEIATLIALTAAAAQQLTSSASENLLKTKRNWTKERRRERAESRLWMTTSYHLLLQLHKVSWPTGLPQLQHQLGFSFSLSYIVSCNCNCNWNSNSTSTSSATGIFLPRPDCRYRYRYKHTHTHTRADRDTDVLRCWLLRGNGTNLKRCK